MQLLVADPLIVIGVILSLTGIGLIIGLPLLALGVWIFWWAHTKKSEKRSKELMREAIREEKEEK